VTVHCGVDTYLFGSPDRPVEEACRGVYRDRAAVLTVCAGLLVFGLGAAAQLVFTRRRMPARRLAVAFAATVFAVIAVVALRPVDVVIRTGTTRVVARCGLDAYVAGHPDHAVQAACQAGYGRHAASALAAAVLALVTLGGLRLVDGRDGEAARARAASAA
jgi:hypothetical protein